MKLQEMDGFLKGKCLPGDMLVNETSAEYLVRKFAELQSALDVQSARSDALAVENVVIIDLARTFAYRADEYKSSMFGYSVSESVDELNHAGSKELTDAETPATDAWVNEQRAAARKEGAYFVANRMLAAWDAGFIDDTAKNAADIARMILTSTEFMSDAHEGDFNRSFADSLLGEIAAQLRGSQV